MIVIVICILSRKREKKYKDAVTNVEKNDKTPHNVICHYNNKQ